MDETKVILENDNMAMYADLKEKLKTDANLRMRCLNRGLEFTQRFITYNDDKIRYYHAYYRLFFSKNLTPYLRPLKSASFSFDKRTKKITTFNTILSTVSTDTIDKINEILGVEWFSNLNNYKNYENISKYKFYNKTILSLVWGKKITNPEDLIKAYSKRILQLKNISWSRVRKFLNRNDHYFFGEFENLKYIDEWVENPNLFIDKITLTDDNVINHLHEYRDYLYQIVALQIKSNVSKWSIKRMLEEHSKLSNILMGLEIDKKDDKLIFSDIYNKYLPENIRCRFINTEKLCFMEGSSMNNCIYTNYWGAISSLRYIAVSIDDRTYGRATLGISCRQGADNNLVFYVDQIRGIRNCACDKELSEIMYKWVDDNQEILREIKEKKIVENLDITKKDSIFANENEIDINLDYELAQAVG